MSDPSGQGPFSHISKEVQCQTGDILVLCSLQIITLTFLSLLFSSKVTDELFSDNHILSVISILEYMWNLLATNYSTLNFLNQVEEHFNNRKNAMLKI